MIVRRGLGRGAALAVCVLLAAAGGGSAQDGGGDVDDDGGTAHAADWREFVIWTDQEWGDLDDPEPPTGLLWWECLTATCVWPEGYGEIVAVTDEYEAAAKELKKSRADHDLRVIDLLVAQEDMTEVIDAQPRLNVDGDHTAVQGDRVACVSRPGDDTDKIGYCYTRWPPRSEAPADIDDADAVWATETRSLWGYAGDERFLEMTKRVRHHNIYRCNIAAGQTCWWPITDYDPPGADAGWTLPVAWVIEDDASTLGFDYDDDGRIDSHGENTHPAIDKIGMDGLNEDGPLTDIEPGAIVASFCEVELDGADFPHCGNARRPPGALLGPGEPYLGDSHPAHRRDRPLLQVPMCFERSDFAYPATITDRSKEYRQAEFDGWPVWVPWITERVHDNGYYTPEGLKLAGYGSTTLAHPLQWCGPPDNPDNPGIADVRMCDFLYPDPPWRVQAYEPTGPPSYAYERDGGLLADGSPVLEGNWVRLSEDLDEHPLGQALKSPDGDMDSLIVEDDTLRYTIAPDLSRLHSYPPFAYDREGNRARYMAPTPPAYRLDTAQNLWLPVCWYRH